MESIFSFATAQDPRPFEELEPAYRHGRERAASLRAEQRFEEVESELERTWPSARGSSFSPVNAAGVERVPRAPGLPPPR